MEDLKRNESASLEKLDNEHAEYAVGADADVPTLSPAEEKKLVRKIDFKLVPFLSLLYLLSFLDRVNIGQAKLDGIIPDLGLTANQFQITLLVFFVGYVSFEIPSNTILKMAKPSRYISACMLLWGITMTLMGIVKSFGGLVAARFCLGIAESPLFPGISYYLVSWYKREESNLRVAIFFSSATIAGAFGGILAWAISKMRGIGGKPGWSWIFIIEGLMTVAVSLVAPWMIQDFPEDAKFLTEKERKFVVHRLRQDTGGAGNFRWLYVKNAFRDWKTYVSCIFTIISAFISDRMKQRGIFNIGWMSTTCIGYIILLAIDVRQKPGVAYFAVFLCVGGIAPCIANSIAWIGGNTAPVIKRGTAMGVFFMTGNSGGIISSVIYRAQDKPAYRLGHGVSLGFSVMALTLSIFMRIWFARENARRDAKYGPVPKTVIGPAGVETTAVRDDPVLRAKYGLEGMSEEDIEALGDKSPFFRYLL
ncbi:hypothetical protein JCM8202v2_003262 [Rhodotorula sphaerocarpa]